MKARITELEIKIGHCEHSIDELNRAAFRQQQQMDLLQAQMRELYRLTQSGDTTETHGPRDEIPPHY